MKNESQDGPSFNGFEQSNTTPVPDVLFDELLEKLTGAELKVLLYIIRRTAGFKKTTDAISLTQFEKGITTRDGKQLDRGCGIKRRQTIVDALVSLEKKGCIVSYKTKTNEGDDATTVYQIRFKGVVSKPDHPSSSEGSFKTVPPSYKTGLGVVAKTVPPVVSKPYPQETVIQQTELQERKNGASQQKANDSDQKPSIPSPIRPSFSPEEETVYQLAEKLNISYLKKNEKNKVHCSKLAKKGLKTLEQMESLMQFCKQRDYLKDKDLNLGNLAGEVDGWLQLQEPPKAKAKRKLPTTREEWDALGY